MFCLDWNIQILKDDESDIIDPIYSNQIQMLPTSCLIGITKKLKIYKDEQWWFLKEQRSE